MTQEQTKTLDDHELVLRVADGDVAAFEAIYDRYSGQLFGLALLVTGRRRRAEEATQDAFVTLWRTARSYDPSKGALKTWLMSVVRNRSIDLLRREARHDHALELDDAHAERLESAENTEEQVAGREEARHTRELLASLPREQRRVIELAYFRGLTQTEIADRVGIPLGTVKGRQRLALTKMHRKLTSAPEVALTRA